MRWRDAMMRVDVGLMCGITYHVCTLMMLQRVGSRNLKDAGAENCEERLLRRLEAVCKLDPKSERCGARDSAIISAAAPPISKLPNSVVLRKVEVVDIFVVARKPKPKICGNCPVTSSVIACTHFSISYSRSLISTQLCFSWPARDSFLRLFWLHSPIPKNTAPLRACTLF